MSSSGLGNGSPRGQVRSRQAAARNIARAVAERQRGRRRLNAATATVGFASVIAAGAVAAVLPGSTHQTVTNPGSSSVSNSGTPAGGSQTSGNGSAGSGSGSANSSSSSSNSTNSSNSSNLQAPTYAPVQSSGGSQATSGGTSGW